MTVLDITHIPIHKGADIGSAMQATANLMNKAPGFRIAYWGVQIENGDTMDLLVGKSVHLLRCRKLQI